MPDPPRLWQCRLSPPCGFSQLIRSLRSLQPLLLLITSTHNASNTQSRLQNQLQLIATQRTIPLNVRSAEEASQRG